MTVAVDGSTSPAGPEPDDALAALDALASAWLDAARPIEFRVASPRELEDVLRLRYRVVVEAGWAAPDDFPDGIERDAHDGAAVHIVGRDGPGLAATSRLVPPTPDGGLPLEEFFGITLEQQARLVELDRIVVAPSYRERGHRILAGLLGRSWQEARARGFNGIVGIASAPMIERYEEIGLQLTILGAARRYWNEDRFPVRLDVGATVAARAR